MGRLRIGQAKLASSCGYTQSYISKVLNKRVKITQKMERELVSWLSGVPAKDEVSSEEVEILVRRLAAAKPERRIHIMHILRGLAEIS